MATQSRLTFGLMLKSIRLLPHLAVWRMSGGSDIISQDIVRWSSILYKAPEPGCPRLVPLFLCLMNKYPEFRSLFYYRVGGGFFLRAFLKGLCPPLSSLYIRTPEIGPGLFIQHGFSTIIAGKKIGANCWINQQVTIGYSNANDCPILGDNVYVYAGAKVIGGVTVGNNVKVGANAVVIKDVPADCTVVGVPGKIVKIAGRRPPGPPA